MRTDNWAAVALSVTLALSAGGAAGCTDGDGIQQEDLGADAGVVVDPELDAMGKACEDKRLQAAIEWGMHPGTPLPAALDDELAADLVRAAPARYAAGDATIPLSPSGCSSLIVRRSGGVVTEELLIRAPFKSTFDQTTFQISYRPTAISRWTYTSTGFTYTGDHDADGYDETRETATYGMRSVHEERDHQTDTVIARTTSNVQPGDETVEVVEERLRDGALAEWRRFTTSLTAAKCNNPADKPPAVDPNAKPVEYTKNLRDCNVDETKMIADAVATAAVRGSGCLFYAGLEAQSDQVIKAYTHNDFTYKCSDDATSTWVAANDKGYLALHPGQARIIVNTVGFFNGSSEGFRNGTMAHELFHFFDTHDRDLEAAADDDQMRRSDRVNACEYLCFGSMPTECHLAACQGKKLSTAWKGKSCSGTVKKSDVGRIEKARGDGVNIASCGTGQNVGALCRSVMGTSKVLFCDTAMECEAACGAPCDSKSLSCLDECK